LRAAISKNYFFVIFCSQSLSLVFLEKMGGPRRRTSVAQSGCEVHAGCQDPCHERTPRIQTPTLCRVNLFSLLDRFCDELYFFGE
jgi:hypothetical protein